MKNRKQSTPNSDQYKEEILQHIDSIYSFAYNFTLNRTSAEDLAQEAILRGFQNYHQYQPGTNFRAWIFTIIRNLFINQYRKEAKEPQKVEYDEYQSYYQQEAVSVLENELFSENTQVCINKLPEVLRTTVELYYCQQLNYKEIAGVCACPVGTVMSRLHTARNELKKCMIHLAEKEA